MPTQQSTDEREIREYLDGAQEIASVGMIANLGDRRQGPAVMTLVRVPKFDFNGVPLHDSSVDTRWSAISTDKHRVGALDLWWPNGTTRRIRFGLETSIGLTLMLMLRESAKNGIAVLSVTDKKRGKGQVTSIDIEIDNDEVFALLEELTTHFARERHTKEHGKESQG